MGANRVVRLVSCCLILTMLAVGLSACKGDPYDLNAKNPEYLTVWHYYNGAQMQMFDELVTQFNETVGIERGITVEAYSQGTVNELSGKVMDALNRKVGSGPAPDIFAAYADTAYEIHRMGMVADIGKYLTKEDLALYVPAYLAEGEFENGALMIMPVAKSTEIFILNETDWRAFADATGTAKDGFATWEGIADIARRYYEWTDAQTEAPGDGKAFFGRDAMANYLIIGSMQLGKELFHVENGKVSFQVDKDIVRRLWDNYYVPYVNGWYASIGRFRSDDAKTGDIIALVGSTTGATYFPREVTRPDATSYPIEAGIYQLPNFEGTDRFAVQQGAGMVVTRSTEKREYAASVFLQWFTKNQQNLRFCMGSGYLPVETAANDVAALESAEKAMGTPLSPIMKSALVTGMQTASGYTLYTNKAFEDGTRARAIVNDSMQDKANADLAQIHELVKGGMSRAEAVQRFDTDENFETWFTDFTAALDACVAEGEA